MFGRKSVLEQALLRRFVVTLAGGEGTFSGVLVQDDGLTAVFESCVLLTTDGESPVQGRVYVDRVSIAYLQEIIATGG